LTDETAMYLEDPRQITVNKKVLTVVVLNVVLKSTDFASMRVTVLSSVRSNNTKLIPDLFSETKINWASLI